MVDYRYTFLSMRDETVIAEIPLQGTYMDMELNVGGRFDGTFHLDQTGLNNTDLIAATIPGKTMVIPERGGIPIGAYIIWSRVYQSQAKVVQLYGQSFETYPQYQLMRTDFSRFGIEQRNIFRDLWTDMQSVSGRNVNVNVPSPFTTVVGKTVNVLATDYKKYSEVMSSLSDAGDGFDWYISVVKTGNTYAKNLVIGYPTAGSQVPQNTVFEYPGSILNYYATEGMADAGTNVFTFGGGEGSSMGAIETTQDVMIAQGWPRWDKDVSRKDIDSQTILQSVAQQEAAKRRPPMLTFKPTIKADRIPEFGSFGLGDAARLVIKDARFPDGATFDTRIVKWTLHPQASDNTDEFDLIFAGDEDG